MRLLRIWIYHFQQALSGMLHNGFIHAISIGTITISLLIFGAFALLYVNACNWMVEWGKSVSMTLYLDEGIDPTTKNEVEAAIRSFPGAQVKDYVSKEKALSDLKSILASQAVLLDGLSNNPLPASFDVAFQDIKKSEFDPKKVKGELEKIKGVSEVQYSEQYQEQFEGLIHALKVAGLIAGLLLCMAVLFIVTNTIKLTIYSRRDEIAIYKLVGASDWFVRSPLLIEGSIHGLLGGTIALLILFSLHLLFSMDKIHVLGLLLLRITFLPYHYCVFVVLLGLLLGLTGSFIAIGRFFRT